MRRLVIVPDTRCLYLPCRGVRSLGTHACKLLSLPPLRRITRGENDRIQLRHKQHNRAPYREVERRNQR